MAALTTPPPEESSSDVPLLATPIPPPATLPPTHDTDAAVLSVCNPSRSECSSVHALRGVGDVRHHKGVKFVRSSVKEGVKEGCTANLARRWDDCAADMQDSPPRSVQSPASSIIGDE